MMVEFQEVMKQWNRMCNSNTCDECEIYKKGLKWVCGGHEGRLVREEVKAAEIIIMQWAAEHPEPVYHGVRCKACSTDDALSMVDESQRVEAIPLEWLTKRMGEELEKAVLIGGEHNALSRSLWNVVEYWRREAKA